MRRALGLALAAMLGAIALMMYGPAWNPNGDLTRGRLEHRQQATGPYGAPSLIAAARARLQRHPDDARTWTALGTAYVEQARVSANPSYYTAAEQALHEALELRPDTAEDLARAQTGLGALANARHEFQRAERWAERARKLDPDHWIIYGVLADARLQLGKRKQAEDDLRTMMDLRPGVAAYTRAAHYFTLTGRPARAAEALDLALSAASSGELSFCYERQGELAWHRGKPHTALIRYQRALTAEPRHAAALAGRGRALAALGRTEEALRDYTASLKRAPHPAVILELGDLYTALGRTSEAAQQFALFKTVEKLFRDSGVQDGLLSGRYQSDHGSPVTAVRLLRAEWRKAPSAETADALGWALHRAGQHAQALTYARRATEADQHRAEFFYHRGRIEQQLGHTGQAREHLELALRLNPHFSPLHAPKAKAALVR